LVSYVSQIGAFIML